MNLLRSLMRPAPSVRSSGWMTDSMTFGGLSYPLGMPSTTLGFKQEDIGYGYTSYAYQAMMANPIVFACMEYRRKTFSQARFQWQRLRSGTAGPAGEYFGTADLGILEQPWTNATTPDLLNAAIQHADLGGNAFIVRRGGQLALLRPDWTAIIAASTAAPDQGLAAIDAKIMGYAYWPGGKGYGADPEILLPEEVGHFAPTPDPTARFRGMSWITPIVREVMGDQAATTHKLKYFENGASSNTVVKFDPAIVDTLEKFDAWVEKLEQNHRGVANAYKTWYVGAGADPTVIGDTLRQVDFKVTQGAGETRIAAASGVHPVLTAFSEGLQGSALNAGNYQAARRSYIDGTLWDLWGNISGALQSILPTPPASRLWVDGRHISLLKEDEKDLAEIQQMNSASIGSLVTAGYTPDSVVAAVTSGDFTRLSHSGLYSVQLQPPGTQQQLPAKAMPALQAASARLLAAGIRPTTETLAEELDVSERTIRRWRSEG